MSPSSPIRLRTRGTSVRAPRSSARRRRRVGARARDLRPPWRLRRAAVRRLGGSCAHLVPGPRARRRRPRHRHASRKGRRITSPRSARFCAPPLVGGSFTSLRRACAPQVPCGGAARRSLKVEQSGPARRGRAESGETCSRRSWWGPTGSDGPSKAVPAAAELAASQPEACSTSSPCRSRSRRRRSPRRRWQPRAGAAAERAWEEEINTELERTLEQSDTRRQA